MMSTGRPTSTAGSRDHLYGGRSFDEAEPELRREWESAKDRSRLAWDKAKHATRDAWNRVDKRDRRMM